MSKISINSDIMVNGVKIYSVNGDIYAEITGAANTDVGVASFNLPPAKLDFADPSKTDISAYAFMDGKGKVGYDFNFGDVIFKLPDDEPNEDSENLQDTDAGQSEEDVTVEGEA